MEQNGSYQWVPNSGPQKPIKPVNRKKILRFSLLGLLALLVFFGAMTSFYTVDDKQQGVVTTFGKVSDVVEPGLHFKLPFGIQQVHHVDINVYQKIELGYYTDSKGNSVSVVDESSMITGDYNIVNVDFLVEYKISDPVRYLFSSEEPSLILKNLIQSQVRNVVGSSTVDAVLTSGKENIQMQVKELVSQILKYSTDK